jgi:hypothetical protein
MIENGRNVKQAILEKGFAWIPQAAWSLDPVLRPHWHRLVHDWDSLELDRYLETGAKFRLRRYGRYSWAPAHEALTPLLHETYFQPEDENSYAGGIVREFAPLLPDTIHNPFLHELVRTTFACLPVSEAQRADPWEVRIHQIRIVASPEAPGLPAPEGIHQDGTDFLTLHLVRRQNIAGGETTIYDLGRRPIQHLTLRDSLDSLILEDSRIMHGVTPVYSADGRTPGIRDMLGVDFLYGPRLQQPGTDP